MRLLKYRKNQCQDLLVQAPARRTLRNLLPHGQLTLLCKSTECGKLLELVSTTGFRMWRIHDDPQIRVLIEQERCSLQYQETNNGMIELSTHLRHALYLVLGPPSPKFRAAFAQFLKQGSVPGLVKLTACTGTKV